MDKKFKETKKHLDTNYKEKYTYDKDGRAIIKMNIKKDGESYLISIMKEIIIFLMKQKISL